MRRLPLTASSEVGPAGRATRSAVAAGGVVLLPTETFYGLGADPASAAAVTRILALKGRPAAMPLSVLCADWSQLVELVEIPERRRAALEAVWPGALTAILPARRRLPCAPGPAIAVRIPGHALLCGVLRICGPLTGTSANRHGSPPCRGADDALASLLGAPDLVLDGGPTPGGAASTLVDLTQEPPLVLRDGPVGWLEQV